MLKPRIIPYGPPSFCPEVYPGVCYPIIVGNVRNGDARRVSAQRSHSCLTPRAGPPVPVNVAQSVLPTSPVSLLDSPFVRDGFWHSWRLCGNQAAIRGGTVNTAVTRFTVRWWETPVIPDLGYSRFNAGNGLFPVLNGTHSWHSWESPVSAVLAKPLISAA